MADNPISSFITAIVIIIFGVLYAVSPIDLLPGPIDDVIVAVLSAIASVKKFAESINQIPRLLIGVIALIVILIVTVICCKIFG